MSNLLSFEIEKHEPYRFIGKSVYAHAGMQCGQANFAGFLWDNSAWIFDKLNELKDYATNEIHNAALLTWEKYDPNTKLLGYTVGRFMKADTPVPSGMDFFDIPAGYIAKGWFDKEDGDEENMVRDAIEQQGEYKRTSGLAGGWFGVEVNGNDTFGYYLSCEKKN